MSIPHSRPLLGEEERAAVAAVLDSGLLSGGGWQWSASLERRMAALVGRPRALAVSSGSTGLEIAFRALGVGGERVVVPAFGCVSLGRSVRRAGGVPVLVDVDPSDLGIARGAIDAVARGVGMALVVHQFGLPSAATEEAADAGVRTVEDFTTLVGGWSHGRPAGGHGALAVASLGATKMLCAGEGGVVVGDAAAVEAASGWAQAESDLPAESPTLNGRMDQLSAAVALAQLDRLPMFVARRHAIAEYYLAMTEAVGLEVKQPAAGQRGTWWRFLVSVAPGCDIDAVVSAARAHGVWLARPVTTPWWRGWGCFPHAEQLFASLISVPTYPALCDAEVETVCRVARSVLTGSLAAAG